MHKYQRDVCTTSSGTFADASPDRAVPEVPDSDGRFAIDLATGTYDFTFTPPPDSGLGQRKINARQIISDTKATRSPPPTRVAGGAGALTRVGGETDVWPVPRARGRRECARSRSD
jgi:hypothetical protein